MLKISKKYPLGLLAVFIPGLLITFYLVYRFGSTLYRIAAWNHTTGEIVGLLEDPTGEESSFTERATFRDQAGKTMEALAQTSVTDPEDAAEGSVHIVFDPADSHNAHIVMLRDYLSLLMLPFTIFLIWLGSPFESSKINNRKNSISP